MSLKLHCIALDIFIKLILKVFENYTELGYFRRCFVGKILTMLYNLLQF